MTWGWFLLVETGLQLGKLIYHSHPSGFTGALCLGRRGVGKSCYALRVAHEVFRHSGMTPNNAWRAALDCLKFEIPDVIKFLKISARQPEPARILIWDDVGVFAGSSVYFSDYKLVQRLKAVLDSIRTACSGLIMTTPVSAGLLGLLKSYDDFQVEIKHTNRGGQYRSAVGYQFHTLPSGKRICHKRFVDSFNVWVPTWVFREYKITRSNALITGIDRLEEVVVDEK